MKLLTGPKAVHRSWKDHFLYLTAVSDACGGTDNLVLENIVHYADPSARMMMLSWLVIHRMDYLRQAEELSQFAQSTEIEVRTKHFGRDVVNAVDPRKTFKNKEKIDHQSLKKCYRCGNVGHLNAIRPCREKQIQQEDSTLAIGSCGATSKSHWILDSGSRRHLVNDLNFLEDPVDFNSECLMAASDGEPIRIRNQGSVVITVKALGVRKTFRLLDVQYDENLERNIISYGKLEQKGCVLEYREGRRVLVSFTGGVTFVDVNCGNNVFFVEVYEDKFREYGSTTGGIMTVLAKSEHESDLIFQCGTLVKFHLRLGHLCYDTIIKMAGDPASGIKLTDTERESCLACAQGKQTKNVQSNKDTGKNSPIDVMEE
uniref:Uncharacterized protein AlNc14C16G1778 n=1 Tax=Albugo laibachii Nc14 TaxID=890382 RepID=F0W4A7_9STRA|nr:conserved hypothetical protein [Albugo laibachii Nc14]|eukprot:CCA15940.1 conserved hypothetical protein [Albugo laibachii Nc14]